MEITIFSFWSKYGDYCAEWIYPERIKSIDNSGTTLPSGEGININRKTAYLVAHGFDFSSIPSNATITGVEVKIVRKRLQMVARLKIILLS